MHGWVERSIRAAHTPLQMLQQSVRERQPRARLDGPDEQTRQAGGQTDWGEMVGRPVTQHSSHLRSRRLVTAPAAAAPGGLTPRGHPLSEDRNKKRGTIKQTLLGTHVLEKELGLDCP